MSGIRWWEIRSPNSTPILYQEGTYNPGATEASSAGWDHRPDRGNMALGYSASTAHLPSRAPGTPAACRRPLGTMPQGEASIFNGTGSQTSPQRWGDYTSMNVDPADDCTFWAANEYLPTTGT